MKTVRRLSRSDVPLASNMRSATQAPVRGDADRAQVSLHAKILVGYMCVAAASMAVFYFGERLDWALKVILSGIVTLLLAVSVPSFFLRVSRVRVLSKAAQEISMGDLSRRVQIEETQVKDDIDELAVSIGNMQENLRELVSSIQRTAEAVADSAAGMGTSAQGVNAQAQEVGQSVKRIAQGAETQTTLVTRASKTMNDMAQALSRTALSAEESAKAATATSASAVDGSTAAQLAGEKVRKVFNRIEDASKEVFKFGEKTQEISKIVDAITQVAQQTNLLALNATIEAARAGEYGRGFAVVADEVRKLADAAGRSAEQISRLARDISQQSGSVVSAMKEGIAELAEGREDLGAIVKSMARISDTAQNGAEKVALISDFAREQQRGSDAMVQAITEISSVARTNAQSTEEVTRVISEQTQAVAEMNAEAQELSTIAEELQTIVRRFRLGSS
jgi:methyl-accepting chemotaxis protein